MPSYLIIVVLLIGGVYLFSKFASKKLIASAMTKAQNMTPEEAKEAFEKYFSADFVTQKEETIVGHWTGVVFTGAKSTASSVAGEALNFLSKNAIGVSTYTPGVKIALTSQNRLLVALERSELGERNHWSQVSEFPAGSKVLSAAEAKPGESVGDPPRNESGGGSYEFIQLRSHDGEEVFEAWLSPSGTKLHHPGFIAIREALA